MKHSKVSFLSLFLFVFILIQPTFSFAQSDTLKRVDEACAVFPTYKSGENGAALSAMERAVLAIPPDSADRAAAERKLLDAFPTATLDGQRTIARVLFAIASDATIESLKPMSQSDANRNETGKIVRALIRAVQDDRPVAYPKNEIFLAPYKPGEFYRNDFKVESDDALAKRLDAEIAAVLNCKDSLLRRDLLEKLGPSIERAAVPLDYYKKLLATPEAGIQKQVFDVMGRFCRSVDALEFAAEWANQENQTRVNAALAVVRMANVKRYAEPDRCRKILYRVYNTIENDDVRGRAKAVLLQLDYQKGYIFNWQGTEVLSRPGADSFNEPFAAEAETAGTAETAETAETQWLPLQMGRVKLGWDLDVARDFPKDSCVYMRTFVNLEKDRALVAQLDVLTPVKVWINGKPVFARNARGAVVEFPVQLTAGWNEIRVKVVSVGGPCPFSLRFCELDGMIAEGLDFRTEKK